MTGKKTAFLVLAALFIAFFTGCRRVEEKVFFEVSPDTATVYGYVKDYAGNPIEDAEITILPTGDKIKSEKDGLYRFSIGLGELPADAVITYVIEKSGFVPSRASISFAELLSAEVATQKRVKRQDVVLYPPAEIEVEVVDKDNKPVAGSRVLVFPSLDIALYLGIVQNEAVASITSQTTPVKITNAVPAIRGNSVKLVAYPPQGLEEDYNVSSTSVDVSQIKAKGKVVLKLKPLEIVYSSVAVGQFISPDENIKLIFSKEITGINAQLICNVSPVNLTANITGAEVEIDPAGRILGNCQLTVNNALGKKGETLIGGPYSYNFIAYDPNAPRGFACPDIAPALPGSVTAVSFESVPPPPPFLQAIYYSPAPDSFKGFGTETTSQIRLIWDPPAVRGIKEFKVRYLKESEKLKGSGRWQTAGVGIQFIPHLNKWVANLNFTSLPFDISYGEKYYIAVVPVNLNDEEVCNPENIPAPFTIQDNTPPRITKCSIDIANYSAGRRTIEVQFSEHLTSAKSITITSRNFEVIKIEEDSNPLASPPSLQLQVYLDPLSAKIPADPENANGDKKLLLLNDEAKKLWVGELVDVRRVDGTTFFDIEVTAIIGGLANSIVWFDTPILGDAQNGAVVPQTGNLLQSPNNGNLYVLDAAGKRLRVSSATGLTIGDRIQVADPFSNTRKILTIKSVNSATSEITVEEDISDLKCNSNNKLCLFRSFNPDVSIKVEAYDTSGNLISSLADQCSVDGGISVIIW